jgi:hypothetical protein
MADLLWLKRLGDYDVIRREIPRPGGKPYYLNSSTQIGVLHTTEGDTVGGAWRALRQQNAAPHSSPARTPPSSAVQASTLRPGRNNTANVHAQIQIEMVAQSRQALWLPKSATLEPTVAILASATRPSASLWRQTTGATASAAGLVAEGEGLVDAPGGAGSGADVALGLRGGAEDKAAYAGGYPRGRHRLH